MWGLKVVEEKVGKNSDNLANPITILSPNLYVEVLKCKDNIGITGF